MQDVMLFCVGDVEIPNEDMRTVGPRFQNGEFSAVNNKIRLEQEVWNDRKKAFKENLDILEKRFNYIYLHQEEDYQRDLANLEGDIEKLVAEYLGLD